MEWSSGRQQHAVGSLARPVVHGAYAVDAKRNGKEKKSIKEKNWEENEWKESLKNNSGCMHASSRARWWKGGQTQGWVNPGFG